MRASSWIIISCFLIYLVILSSPDLIKYLAFTPMDIYHLRFWTPITALFVHAGLAHLLCNMLFLFVLGRTLEGEVGASRFLEVFFIGGALSFILSAPLYGSDVRMVGASAAIFSVASAVMLVKPQRFSIIFLAPVGVVSLLYFIYNILYIILLDYRLSYIAYTSHIIGFILGIPFGIMWSENWKKNLGITIILVSIYVILIWIVSNFIVRIPIFPFLLFSLMHL